MKLISFVAACAVAGSMSCAAQAATISVTTPAQLDAALKKAVGGDIIKVGPGNYGDFDIRAINPASAVNIVASNSSRPPVFTHLTIRDSSQLRFTRMTVISPAPDSTSSVLTTTEIYRSHDIRLAGMVFSGVAGGSVSNEPRGLRLSQSSSITVATSSFTELSHAIAVDGSSRMTITDNEFWRIRTDGIIADGASASLIARNRFSSFQPEGLDHPDAIQIFNNFTPTTNLKVEDNLIIGDDEGQMQGIFMTNSVGDRAQLDRISIANNLLWGTMWNGIAAFDGNRVAVTDNMLLSNADLAVSRTYIRLEGVTAATVSGNSAGAYIYSDLGTLSGVGNVVSIADVAALLAVTGWDASHAAGAHSLAGNRSSMTGWNGAADMLRGGRASSIAAAVPEPAGWASLIFGFLAVGVARRRLQPARARRIYAA